MHLHTPDHICFHISGHTHTICTIFTFKLVYSVVFYVRIRSMHELQLKLHYSQLMDKIYNVLVNLHSVLCEWKLA